jgi:L,D-transpeptidase catalytic domain
MAIEDRGVPPAEELAAPAAGGGAAAAPPPAAAALPPAAPAVPPALRRRLLRRRLDLLGLLLLVALVAAAYVASLGGAYRREALAPAAAADPGRVTRLERRLASLAPRGTYLVVDTYGNRLRVFRGDQMLRDAVCSTGSGTVLKDPKSGREWVFDTPQGERRVQRKVKDPVWVKPDWAFIEEGYEPPKNSRDRVDDFSLGDYGLYLGDGYIIHGTLFQTLLGKGVTHGCIRLGDADLEWVYWRVGLGTPVYLY